MILTRDKGQRMWGGGGGSSYSYGGGGGGESPSFDGFVSNEYYNQNFELLYKQEVTAGGTTTTTFMTAAPNIIVPVGTVTDETTQTTTVTSLVGPVAKNAIVLGNIMMVYDQTNNAIKVVNRDGSTAANFYATGGVSALGYNPGGGGGGGADLNALLDSINSSNIGDIAPTASEVGKCLVYNGNNQWAWATPGGGGGLTYGLSWSYGSVASAQGGSYDGSAIKSFVIPKDTSHLSNGAGFITSAALSGYLPLSGGTMTGSIIMKGVNIYMDPADSSSNATPDIVFRYGNGSEKARIWVDDTFSSALGPQFRIYNTAGTQIVSTRLALASQIPSLVGYATQQWVNDQGFLTEDQYKGTVTKVSAGTGITTNPSGGITSSGTVSISGTYQTYISHGESAYNKLSNATWWGQSMNSSGVVDGTISVKSSVAGTIDLYQPSVTSGNQLTIRQNTAYAEIWNRASTPILVSSGIFGIGIGETSYITNSSYKLQVAGTAMIGTGYTDTTSGLVIGGAMLKWDQKSKSLYVVQSDGSTAANFYATGGVSALGISTGGSPSVSALTVGTLNVTSYADISNLTLQSDMNANSCNIEMEGGNITNVGDLTTDTLNVNGTTIKRIYWNGTYLQVQIGSSTYNFKPV